eukprot:2086839-Alexandrium_andersonii.AAC.1
MRARSPWGIHGGPSSCTARPAACPVRSQGFPRREKRGPSQAFGQRLTYTDKRLTGAAHRLQRFAA